jgi:hypothetical protein
MLKSLLPKKLRPSTKKQTAPAAESGSLLIGYAREEDIRALFELLGMLVSASPHASPDQLQELERFMSAQVPSTLRQLATTSFNQGKELPHGEKTILSRAFQLYGFRGDRAPENWLQPIQVLDILLRFALVDGRFSDAEAYVVELVRKSLGIHLRSYWIVRDTLADRYGAYVERKGPSFKAGQAPEVEADPKREQSKAKRAAPRSGTTSREKALTTLGLSKHANSEEIRLQYRSMVKQCHPDLVAASGSEEAIKTAALRFCEVQEAYEYLKSLEEGPD